MARIPSRRTARRRQLEGRASLYEEITGKIIASSWNRSADSIPRALTAEESPTSDTV